jgi:hypothetical protein
MTKHTALPWAAEFDAIYVPHEGAVAHADTERPEHRANAAFIVKAVNCHYDLLAALKKCADFIESLPYQPSIHPSTKAQDAARDAIAKAEGK